MVCVPNVVPYVLPPPIYNQRVRRRNINKTGAIIGGVIGFVFLVAIITAGVVLTGGAGAAATTAFVPATKEIVTFGVFVLTPL